MKMCKITESVVCIHEKPHTISQNVKSQKVAINNLCIKTEKKNSLVHVTCGIKIAKNVKFIPL